MESEDAKIGEAKAVRYREWDASIQDYRMNWCRVVEREAIEGTSDFVEETLAAQRGAVTLLRRYFEVCARPGSGAFPVSWTGKIWTWMP